MTTESACTLSPSSCFILMPFSKEFLETYTHGIAPAVERAADTLGFSISYSRLDQEMEPGSITKEIVQGIFQAKIVIADLSGGNPNVFYELGIAHSLGKRSILIARDHLRLPFDIRNYRVIQYSATEQGLLALQVELSKAITTSIRSIKLPSNPVYDYLPVRLAEILSTYDQVIAVEQSAKGEIWIIGPNVDMDIMYYVEVVRTNIVKRSIVYKYLLPNTPIAKRGLERFLKELHLPNAKRNLLVVRYIDEHMIESEIVIYNPCKINEKVFLMPPIEDGFHFYYLADKARAHDIRRRFEVLWEDAVG